MLVHSEELLGVPTYIGLRACARNPQKSPVSVVGVAVGDSFLVPAMAVEMDERGRKPPLAPITPNLPVQGLNKFAFDSVDMT